jgi:hypothetical protein
MKPCSAVSICKVTFILSNLNQFHSFPRSYSVFGSLSAFGLRISGSSGSSGSAGPVVFDKSIAPV